MDSGVWLVAPPQAESNGIALIVAIALAMSARRFRSIGPPSPLVGEWINWSGVCEVNCVVTRHFSLNVGTCQDTALRWHSSSGADQASLSRSMRPPL